MTSSATSTTIAHLATHSQSFVTHISPHREVSFLAALRNRYLKQSTPKRALYTNYYVGDCNDLIFGVGLVDYATSRGLQEGEIPKLVRLCIAEVDKRGLNSEGIYRVSMSSPIKSAKWLNKIFTGVGSTCCCPRGTWAREPKREIITNGILSR